MGSYRVILTDSAHEESVRIFDYLIERSPSAAFQFFESLEAAYQQLAMFPQSGPEVQDLEFSLDRYRKLVVGDYVTIYRFANDICVIEHIFHGRQDYQGWYSK